MVQGEFETGFPTLVCPIENYKGLGPHTVVVFDTSKIIGDANLEKYASIVCVYALGSQTPAKTFYSFLKVTCATV